jgi:hypothetical protein
MIAVIPVIRCGKCCIILSTLPATVKFHRIRRLAVKRPLTGGRDSGGAAHV